MAEKDKIEQLSMADVIVGQATQGTSATASRERTKGLMGRKAEMQKMSPLDPTAQLPDFVRDHIEAIREVRRPREMAESPQLDYFQGIDIDAIFSPRRQYHPIFQLSSETWRNRHPAFFIELIAILTVKHSLNLCYFPTIYHKPPLCTNL